MVTEERLTELNNLNYFIDDDFKKTPVIYLAGPYMHENPVVVECRVEATHTITGNLIAQGDCVFSPIPYTHSFSKEGKNPEQGWYLWDLTMLKNCDRLMILELPGYADSMGVAMESVLCAALKIPIENMSWEQIKSQLTERLIATLEEYS